MDLDKLHTGLLKLAETLKESPEDVSAEASRQEKVAQVVKATRGLLLLEHKIRN